MFRETQPAGEASIAKNRSASDAIARRLLRIELQCLGVFEPQHRYYVTKLVVTFCLFLVPLLCLLLLRHWVVFPAAIFLAFAGTQIGFLGHDLGHHQVFRQARKNDTLGLLIMDLLLGFSYGWWTRKHNEHHANPNHLEFDPDIRFPVLAFSLSQARTRPRTCRYVIAHQALFFIPLLFFLPLSMRKDSFAFLVAARPSRRRTIEAVVLAMHFIWYLWFVFGVIGLLNGIIFIALHHAALGTYLGLSFATNHKGRPILDSSVEYGFLERQVITSRNLKQGPIVDYVFGPLGSQIEHHLFPDIPRNQLRRAAGPVKSYCDSHSIPYHETSVYDALAEVFSHLHKVGRQLRKQSDGSTKYGKSTSDRRYI